MRKIREGGEERVTKGRKQTLAMVEDVAKHASE